MYFSLSRVLTVKTMSKGLSVKVGGIVIVVSMFVLGLMWNLSRPKPRELYNNLIVDTDQEQLRFIRTNSFVGNLSSVNVENLTYEQLLTTFHSYPDNTQVLCQRKMRMGKIGDGGWEICDDPEVRPVPPCIVYSFGINYDFSFDDDTAKSYGCHVYSFDPSMDEAPDVYDRSSHVHFYKIGIDGQTYTNQNKWKLRTLADIRRMLGHENKVIDVIKMDVESSEWPAIPDMTSSGAMRDVRQFLVEYHIVNITQESLVTKVKAMQSIEKAGFKIFYTHKNEYNRILVKGFPAERTQCYEVHYIRR
ncbi:probable methyltransferase-like protein 24 [Physella acuta]|uniref:probable methyltransferase-like protein 24 n=1 Tax=Physella acuta TaxID=109671 RepID=UPI0027DD1433|nr:probable methyltransferase-like protein 24 [Physella acuta]